MIKRRANPHKSHNVLRLHSSEINASLDVVYNTFIKKIKETDFKFYPNMDDIYNKISKFFKIKNFILGGGSDRCIKYFFETYRDYENLIITSPTFPMYNVYGSLYKFNIIEVGYKNNKVDIESIIKKSSKNSLIVLSNPSSPIGDVINIEDIKKILNTEAKVLIDEAYIEFSTAHSCLELIDKYNNLYVTRTFSKAYGSAGVRCGVMVSNKFNIDEMYQYRDMYELTGPTIKWIESVLENINIFQKYIKNVIINRDKIIDFCKNKKIDVVESQSNWIHIRGEFNLPDNIIFRKNCSVPNKGNDWIRLQITDNLNDYKWILDEKILTNIGRTNR